MEVCAGSAVVFDGRDRIGDGDESEGDEIGNGEDSGVECLDETGAAVLMLEDGLRLPLMVCDVGVASAATATGVLFASGTLDAVLFDRASGRRAGLPGAGVVADMRLADGSDALASFTMPGVWDGPTDGTGDALIDVASICAAGCELGVGVRPEPGAAASAGLALVPGPLAAGTDAADPLRAPLAGTTSRACNVMRDGGAKDAGEDCSPLWSGDM